MKKNIEVSVSTDPIGDYQTIIEYAKQMQGVADFLHCDIMNKNFVPKDTYDFNLVKNINRNSIILLDVHLMVAEPSEDIEKYIEAGANVITLHYEAFADKEDLVDAIKFIKENDTLAGISLKPNTSFGEVRTYAFNADLVLVMGVEPGASGQGMIPEMVDKVREIYKFREENNLKFKIEFDGGVTLENAKLLTDAGVDILVSGSCVYNSKDRKKTIEMLKGN